MSSNCVWLSVWLQIIFCSCADESMLFSFLQSRRYLSENLLGDRMIKQFIYWTRWITLRISRPLFVGTYLQVTWWALDQWKGRNISNEWCVSQINDLPQPSAPANNWSAGHWQFTIFCSTLPIIVNYLHPWQSFRLRSTLYLWFNIQKFTVRNALDCNVYV